MGAGFTAWRVTLVTAKAGVCCPSLLPASATAWLWEMFEGHSADTRAGKFYTSVDGGPIGGSRVRRPGSEDPHRR